MRRLIRFQVLANARGFHRRAADRLGSARNRARLTGDYLGPQLLELRVERLAVGADERAYPKQRI